MRTDKELFKIVLDELRLTYGWDYSLLVTVRRLHHNELLNKMEAMRLTSYFLQGDTYPPYNKRKRIRYLKRKIKNAKG